MRFFAVGVLVVSGSLWAQDPGLAALQASQQAMQANQQAAQSAQQAMQTNQQMLQTTQDLAINNCVVPAPKLSLAPGTYAGPQTVLLTDRARTGVIYYTTDGWTPTNLSKPFRGPVIVDRSTVLKARAYAPGCAPSAVREAAYVLPAAAPEVIPEAMVVPDGVLRQGTALRFSFPAAMNSETARVGDAVRLQLLSGLRVGDRLLQPDAAFGLAYVTAVHKAARYGQPGEITFALHSLNVGGVSVPLTGEETAEGVNEAGKAQRRSLIFFPVPLSGLIGLSVHGGEAVIPAGAVVAGQVTSNTRLPQTQAQSGSSGAPRGSASQ